MKWLLGKPLEEVGRGLSSGSPAHQMPGCLVLEWEAVYSSPWVFSWASWPLFLLMGQPQSLAQLVDPELECCFLSSLSSLESAPV
jgi:hypothetical protein